MSTTEPVRPDSTPAFDRPFDPPDAPPTASGFATPATGSFHPQTGGVAVLDEPAEKPDVWSGDALSVGISVAFAALGTFGLVRQLGRAKGTE